jgi:hypothetical protein
MGKNTMKYYRSLSFLFRKIVLDMISVRKSLTKPDLRFKLVISSAY